VTFIVSLIFILLFYVVPLYRILPERLLIFPVLGRDGSWLLTATLIYLALLLAASLLRRFEEVVWPSLPALRRELTRRTGLDYLDGAGFKLSLLAIVLFIFTAIELVPLGLAAALGFASLKTKPVDLREVRAKRGHET
jgi:hypothetical protein